jgi:16S rRNA (guanine(966)-N(2))-methyltransferase RsmD
VTGLRIIAGRLKGRRLRGPSGKGLRPTSDRLRETLFNVLADRPVGARVLDGFAGTGGVGLEALSRGAAHVTFVERDARALAVLRQNIEHCDARDRTTVLRADFIGVSRRAGIGETFDLVFVDPPYDTGDLEAVLVEAAVLAAPGALIVLEHSRRVRPPDRAPGVGPTRTVTAGDSALSFYVRPGPPDTMSSSGG